MATTSHYIYQPEVLGVKYNGNEVKRVYINGDLQFDTDRLVFKCICNYKGRLELPYKVIHSSSGWSYDDRNHGLNVQIKEAKTGSNVINFYYKEGTNNRGPRRFHFNSSFEVGKYYIINAKITLSHSNFALALTKQTSDHIVAVYSWGSTPIHSLDGLFSTPDTGAPQRPPIEYLPDHLPVGCKILNELFDNYRVRSNTPLPDNISKWDTSKITSMYKTFQRVGVKIPTLKNWNVSNVTSFSYMFRGSSLNENIGNWKPSKNVTGVYEMMSYTSDNKSGIDLSNWCFPKITNYYEIRYFSWGSDWSKTINCYRSGFRTRCNWYYDRSPKLPKFNNSSC